MKKFDLIDRKILLELDNNARIYFFRIRKETEGRKKQCAV